MHPKVYQEFEKICSEWNICGSVLEVGATPDDSSLLNMKSVKGAKEKIGINLDGPYTYKDFSILKGNANSMTCFEDNRFDVVLCNSVLEHDKYFWKTISEIRRVARSGGLIVIGTPGYTSVPLKRYFKGFFSKIPLLFCLKNSDLKGFSATLCVHNYPGDYYRFSPQTFKEVFFEGLKDVNTRTIMLPPRIIGYGIKP